MSRVVEEQIKKARDILATKIPITKYIEKNRLGRTMGVTGKICCPVHDESTPSFFYDDNKKRCNCFGCGIGGTVVELHFHVMKKSNDKYTMVKSIFDLARDYDVEIPDLYERTVEEKKKSRKPSRRKRGRSGQDDEWIYREKLLGVEGRVRGMSVKDRYKIAGLLDDVWLGKRTAKEVYMQVVKIARKGGEGNQGG